MLFEEPRSTTDGGGDENVPMSCLVEHSFVCQFFGTAGFNFVDEDL
jgi:hypothetical protein